MSGDLQPRKRKDKKKRKESGSLGSIYDQNIPNKFKKSESDEKKIFEPPDHGEKIHIQNEKGIGGNACFKIIFFCLFGLLIGVVGLIYLQSQGSTDVDLPSLEDSRFADYFTGWLDDNNDDHEHESQEHDLTKDMEEGDSEEEEKTETKEDHNFDDVDFFSKLLGIESYGDKEKEKENEIENEKHVGIFETEENINNLEDDIEENESENEDEDEDEDKNKSKDEDENEDKEKYEDEDESKDENTNDGKGKDEDEFDDDDDDDDDDTDDVDEDENEIENEHKLGKKFIYKFPKKSFTVINKGLQKNRNLKINSKAHKMIVNRKINVVKSEEEYDASQEDERESLDKTMLADYEYNRKNKFKLKEYQKIGEKILPSSSKNTDEDDEEDDNDDEEGNTKSNEGYEEEKKEERNMYNTNNLDFELENDDLGSEEIGIIEKDLKGREKSEKSIEFSLTENEKASPECLQTETECKKVEDSVEVEKTRGVTIKLIVGIFLIVVAHLVLVQKWKILGSTPTDESEGGSLQREESSPSPVPPPRTHDSGRGPQEMEESENESPSYGGDLEDEEVKEEEERDLAFEREFDAAEEDLVNNPKAAVKAFEKILSERPGTPRALIGRAKALDRLAETEKSNTYLRQAISAYKSLLLHHSNLLDDKLYLEIAKRSIDRMRFAGTLSSAIDVHKALISKHPNTPKHRNDLAVTYLMLNKISLAKKLLNETLSLWPENGFALVHYGFILKTSENNMEEGAKMLMAGIRTREEGVIEGMFFFHLGDALNRLGRGKEAMEWYDMGVKEGLFLSRYQRSLYNVNRLKAKPWWSKEETTYQNFFKLLEDNWREIRREGLDLLNSKGVNLFKEETENLKDTGDWRQLDLFFRGRKQKNCEKAPVTCALVSSFKPASSCTRGQIKFSVMLPETHVWPHCGPTNCRLRSHLGLVVPKKTFIRVAEETRSWVEGKFIIFDDSFEHEVWHNGTGPRLVLIVDVWHPELTNHERQYLSPI